MPDEIKSLDGDGIKVHGFLSDEALTELYQQVRASIVPLRFGAGVKGKVLEAMFHGIHVFTTTIGAEAFQAPMQRFSLPMMRQVSLTI